MFSSRFLFLLLCMTLTAAVSAQQEISISGSLESNVNFYMEDTLRGATNTPQYAHQPVGTDTWLTLRANACGFDLGLRYDLFINSALLNPTNSYTAQGIGRWFIGRKVGKFDILGGYIYDQFGSGIIFRAYEERPLLIDNALVGVRLSYTLAPDWKLKGIIGRQKNLFDLYSSTLKGVSLEGFKALGEAGTVTIAPGAGILHKTLSDEQMDALAGTLGQYTPADFIDSVPYNSLAVSAYNTLSVGRFSWYIEGALKSEEVINDIYAPRTLWTGDTSIGKFVLEPGYVIYTTVSYAGGGLGISGQYKRTHNFAYRADPFVSLNRGFINFLPPMSRVNTYRLTSRYSPATQDLDEQAIQLDLRYAVRKNLSILVNVSKIIRPEADGSGGDIYSDNRDIYTEVFTQVTWKKPKVWTLIGGLQYQEYDQELYLGKSGAPNIVAVTPYVDYLYKFTPKKSIRFESQYMSTEQDFGSWWYGLVEYSVSPHWIFELSDMWNVKPAKAGADKLHFPTAGVVYSDGPTRYSLRYVKQVEGIVCSGGICRLEPAFSGFKMNITSSF